MSNKLQIPIVIALLFLAFLGGFLWGNKKGWETFKELPLLNAPEGVPLSLIQLLSANPAVRDFSANVEITGSITELDDNKLTIAVKDGEPIEINTDNLTAFYSITNNTPLATVPIFTSQDVKVGEQIIVSAAVDEGVLKARLIRPYTP